MALRREWIADDVVEQQTPGPRREEAHGAEVRRFSVERPCRYWQGHDRAPPVDVDCVASASGGYDDRVPAVTERGERCGRKDHHPTIDDRIRRVLENPCR